MSVNDNFLQQITKITLTKAQQIFKFNLIIYYVDYCNSRYFAAKLNNCNIQKLPQ